MSGHQDTFRGLKTNNPTVNGVNPLEGRRIFIGFGIDKYDPNHFNPLNNAVRDVEAVAELLEKEYGFETVLRITPEDTSLDSITNRLVEFIPKKTDQENQENQENHSITERDSLIIYFSGHGEFNPQTEKTYFAPSDGKTDKSSSLLGQTVLINDILPKIPCFHLTLILDCCFSGGFAKIENQDIKWTAFNDEDESSGLILEKLFSKKSRHILTSGRSEESVSDGKKGEHSPFAKALLTCLHDADDLNYSTLVNKLRPQVILARGGGTVISQSFDSGNHDSGEFIFYRKDKSKPSPGTLKKALLELNYRGQMGAIQTPRLFNLYYLKGTESCGHHLFTHRFFTIRRKNINIQNVIPYNFRIGIQEGVRSFEDLWQLLARDFFSIEHTVQDEKTVVDALLKKIESENCVVILRIEKKCDDHKLQGILSNFWTKLNEILIQGKYTKPAHYNNFFLFILDRRGQDGQFNKDKIEEIKRSELSHFLCFPPILPVDRTIDLEDWWDIHRNYIAETRFHEIALNEFKDKEYIQDAILNICDQCGRPECFNELFLQNRLYI